MTKKRFTNHDDTIIDTDGEQLISTDEIVAKMNELHEEGKGIQDKIFKLLDWLETEKGVSRKEIKEWWND